MDIASPRLTAAFPNRRLDLSVRCADGLIWCRRHRQRQLDARDLEWTRTPYSTITSHGTATSIDFANSPSRWRALSFTHRVQTAEAIATSDSILESSTIDTSRCRALSRGKVRTGAVS